MYFCFYFFKVLNYKHLTSVALKLIYNAVLSFMLSFSRDAFVIDTKNFSKLQATIKWQILPKSLIWSIFPSNEFRVLTLAGGSLEIIILSGRIHTFTNPSFWAEAVIVNLLILMRLNPVFCSISAIPEKIFS